MLKKKNIKRKRFRHSVVQLIIPITEFTAGLHAYNIGNNRRFAGENNAVDTLVHF